MTGKLRRALASAIAAVAIGPTLAHAQGQQVVITGRVVNESGAPLGAASVSLVGMGLGDQTNEEGNYRIVVPGARATGQTVPLEARRLGFRLVRFNVTLAPGATLTHNFTLAANPLQLGEVVITGAGTASSAERIGTVRTPVDSSLIQRSHEPNIVEALAAKAPGVNVTGQSGSPGASSSIRIRGLNTINGTGQPLFVVDGTPIDNTTLTTGSASVTGTIGAGAVGSTDVPNRAADINPNDIESIEILKSGAAAAIYGANASQGVVLITTKSGKAGQTRYSLRSNTRFDDVTQTIGLQRIFGQGSAGVTPTCATPDCSMPSTSWGAKLAPGTPTFNHADELYHTGYLYDNTLQVSGGNERTTFFMSGTATNQDGIIKGPADYYDRYSVRLKATQQLLSTLSLTGNIAYVDDRGRFTQKGSNTSGVNLGAWRTPPEFDNTKYLDPTTGLQRSYRFPNPSPLSATRSRGYDNPFFTINAQDNTQQVGRAFGNVGASWDPLAWFGMRYNLGVDYASDERQETLPQTSSGFPTGNVIKGNIVQYQIDNNLTATFSHAFVEGFDTRATIGGNLNSRNFRQNFITGSNLIAPLPFNLQNTTDYTTADNRTLIRGQSVFGQIQQTFWNQLFLTGTVRNDGFSTFGSSQRRHWFPAASLAWTFTNLYNFGGFLNTGRLRAAYGRTGTQPDVYTTNGYFTSGFITSAYGDQLLSTQGGQGGLFTFIRKPQNNLKPELQDEFETGIDLGFLKGHADAGFTFYNRQAKDVIFDLPLPSATGFTVQAANAGRIRNRGIEATLNIRPLMTAKAEWDIGFQYAQNHNKVLELQGAQAVDLPTGGFFTGTLVSAVKGFPIGIFRSPDFVRCRYGQSDNMVDIFGTGTPVDVNALCRAAKAPKNAVYIDSTGFPVEDPTLRVDGDPTPAWTGSVRTGFRYGRWNITGLLDIHEGGQVWNGTKGALYNFGTHKDTQIRGDSLIFGRTYRPGGGDISEFKVFGPGVGKKVPIDQDWFQGLGSGFGDVSQQFYEDGSYVKLREISVGYTFDQPWMRRATGMSSIDLRFAARNLHTWTKYSGIDPETNLGGAEVAAQGIDYFNNPQTRSFIISVGLNR